MMTEEQKTRLLAAVQRWLGTPFAPYQCRAGKAGGVDCVQLAAALMVEAGVLSEQPDFGNYTLDLAGHTGREMITEWLTASPQFDWHAGGGVPQAGDIVTFMIGRNVNHVGVMVSRRDFVHSMQGRSVRVSTLDDSSWQTRVGSFWRVSQLSTLNSQPTNG